MAIYMWKEVSPLCFTAQEANSSVQLKKTGSPTAVNLEISTDGNTWTDYTILNSITLANVGDKVYMRNKSETPTDFANNNGYYKFLMTGSIAASGDITVLLCKSGTTTLSGGFHSLFSGCSSLTQAPSLPATTLVDSCYYDMFGGCSNLETLPSLPALTLPYSCYANMFSSCSKIKLSTTQTGEYQTPYRIPTTGTGTAVSFALDDMFRYTGGTFTGTPTINTTYYTSNTVI